MKSYNLRHPGLVNEQGAGKLEFLRSSRYIATYATKPRATHPHGINIPSGARINYTTPQIAWQQLYYSPLRLGITISFLRRIRNLQTMQSLRALCNVSGHETRPHDGYLTNSLKAERTAPHVRSYLCQPYSNSLTVIAKESRGSLEELCIPKVEPASTKMSPSCPSLGISSHSSPGAFGLQTILVLVVQAVDLPSGQ